MDNQVPPSQQPRRFFDIVPPRSTAPTPTSRPIVLNNPRQPDPMVMKPIAEKETTKVPVDTQPIEAPDTVEPHIEHNTSISSVTESTESPTIAAEPAEQPEPSEPVTADSSMSETPPLVDVPQDVPATLTASNSPSPEIELPAHTSDNYVVAHHKKPASKKLNVFLIVCIVILLFMIIDLVLDLGFIKSSFSLHTHFFGS